MDSVGKLETRKFAAAKADELLGRLASEIAHVVEFCDEDAVHDLRVAERRFTQCLRVFQPVFRGGGARKTHRKLKRIMKRAGEVRNWDIALKLLAKSEKDGGAGLASQFRDRRRDSAQELVAVLKRRQERGSLDKWGTRLETAAQAAGPAPAVAMEATGLLPDMAKDLFALGIRAARVKASPAALHRFRIALKKFRYSLELFAPLYGPGLDPLLGKIRGGQNFLGDINDCETVRGLVSEFSGAKDFRKWLEKRQRRKTAEFQKYWSETFGDEKEMRRWRDFLRGKSGVEWRGLILSDEGNHDNRTPRNPVRSGGGAQPSL